MDKLITDFSLGLFFWQTVLFVFLIIFLKKYAWKPIIEAVEEREKGIKEALSSAQRAREEMAALSRENERIISEAKNERDTLLRDARSTKEIIISEAKEQAAAEAERILVSAKEQISIEKAKAITELKGSVVDLSVKMAEKVLRSELQDTETHKKLIEKKLNDTKLN